MTATRNSNENNGQRNCTRTTNPVIGLFVSIRFTIVTLSLIAATSVLGSVIKQGGTEEEYLALYPEKIYHFIKLFGLDDIYHSPLFYFLIMLFVVNLSLCTLRRMRRLARRGGDRDIPDIKGLIDAGSGFTIAKRLREDVVRRIGASYRTKAVQNKDLIFEKGSISRYGVLVIHSSILIILLGGLIGQIAGYKGFLLLRVGETKERVASRNGSKGEIPIGFRVRCKDFKVNFYPGGEPRDYVSTVEILDSTNRIVGDGRIRVNEPLSYNGVRFYQSSYGKDALFTFNVNGKKVVLGEQDVYREGDTTFMVARFAPQIHDFGPGVMVAYLEGGEPRTTWLLEKAEKMRKREIPGARIELEKIDEVYYTGLEVSRDPGVPFVISGFALMLFGLYINFFISYRRIYVVDNGETISVAGFTSRNKEVFMDELGRLKEGLV